MKCLFILLSILVAYNQAIPIIPDRTTVTPTEVTTELQDGGYGRKKREIEPTTTLSSENEIKMKMMMDEEVTTEVTTELQDGRKKREIEPTTTLSSENEMKMMKMKMMMDEEVTTELQDGGYGRKKREIEPTTTLSSENEIKMKMMMDEEMTTEVTTELQDGRKKREIEPVTEEVTTSFKSI